MNQKTKPARGKQPLALRIVRWIFPKMERLFPALAHWFFIKVFFTPLNYRVPEKEKALAIKSEQLAVTMRMGKRIRIYRWGKGPLVLFVHGWAGRGTQFRKVIERFVAENFQAVAIDGPAHGKSSGTATNLMEFAEALSDVIKITGTPVAIIAHSFGGAASLYAIVNGLKVDTLIAIATPTIGDEIINTYLRAINGSQKTGKYFKDYILRTTGKPFDDFTALKFIKQLKSPLKLLLIHDSDDEDVTARHAFELMRVFPSAEMMLTNDLGHGRILKDDAVIDRCVTFVRARSSEEG